MIRTGDGDDEEETFQTDRTWWNAVEAYMLIYSSDPTQSLALNYYVGTGSPGNVQNALRTVLEPNGPRKGPIGVGKRVQFDVVEGQVWAHTNSVLHNMHIIGDKPTKLILLQLEIGLEGPERARWTGGSGHLHLKNYPRRFETMQNSNWAEYENLPDEYDEWRWVQTGRDYEELKRSMEPTMKEEVMQSAIGLFAPIIFPRPKVVDPVRRAVDIEDQDDQKDPSSNSTGKEMNLMDID